MSGSVCEFWMVPTVELPPTIPSTSHVTVVSCDPVTVARSACAAPSPIDAFFGETETRMAGRMETENEAAFDRSASGVAMICTVAGDGASAGAVKTPLEETNPHAAPVHPVPATLHEIMRLGLELATGVSVAEKAAVSPALTEDGPTNASENELVTMIVPALDLDGSATLVAFSEMLGGATRICGAAYIPEASTVPHEFPLQSSPESAHMISRFGLPAEFTTPVKGREAPSSTGMVCGESETEMSLTIVTAAAELLVASNALVARTETEAGAGRFAGAVYRPPASTVPSAAFPPVIPFTDQITAEFAASLTVALNACGSPSKTEAVAGAMVTVIFEGGSCGELTSPPQPRNVATRSSARRQRDWVRVEELRPRSFVLRSIAAASARVVPVWCIPKKRRTSRFAVQFAMSEDLFNGRAMRLLLRLGYENSMRKSRIEIVGLSAQVNSIDTDSGIYFGNPVSNRCNP